ncbi:hypothetical protein FOA52_004616 [Chlamydomonas sp. UWO 241]|nr:hypothetical protein FOA52_004616 [Chlamydomonas sp. UWO 241]
MPGAGRRSADQLSDGAQVFPRLTPAGAPRASAPGQRGGGVSEADAVALVLAPLLRALRYLAEQGADATRRLSADHLLFVLGDYGSRGGGGGPASAAWRLKLSSAFLLESVHLAGPERAGGGGGGGGTAAQRLSLLTARLLHGGTPAAATAAAAPAPADPNDPAAAAAAAAPAAHDANSDTAAALWLAAELPRTPWSPDAKAFVAGLLQHAVPAAAAAAAGVSGPFHIVDFASKALCDPWIRLHGAPAACPADTSSRAHAPARTQPSSRVAAHVRDLDDATPRGGGGSAGLARRGPHEGVAGLSLTPPRDDSDREQLRRGSAGRGGAPDPELVLPRGFSSSSVVPRSWTGFPRAPPPPPSGVRNGGDGGRGRGDRAAAAQSTRADAAVVPPLLRLQQQLELRGGGEHAPHPYHRQAVLPEWLAQGSRSAPTPAPPRRADTQPSPSSPRQGGAQPSQAQPRWADTQPTPRWTYSDFL